MTWVLHPQLASDTHHVVSLELSDVLLMDNRLHPWLILVPRVPDAIEWFDLAPDDQHRLLDECARLGKALEALHTPDKLNIAALGNVVSQLHVHVIARFRDDAAWPKPVWGAVPGQPYAPAELAAALASLRIALS